MAETNVASQKKGGIERIVRRYARALPKALLTSAAALCLNSVIVRSLPIVVSRPAKPLIIETNPRDYTVSNKFFGDVFRLGTSGLLGAKSGGFYAPKVVAPAELLLKDYLIARSLIKGYPLSAAAEIADMSLPGAIIMPQSNSRNYEGRVHEYAHKIYDEGLTERERKSLDEACKQIWRAKKTRSPEGMAENIRFRLLRRYISKPTEFYAYLISTQHSSSKDERTFSTEWLPELKKEHPDAYRTYLKLERLAKEEAK